MNEKLTERQRRFVDAYVESGNASAAYRAAGYSAKNADVDAAKMLVNPSVSKAVAKRVKELESERTASLQEVLQLVTSIMRGELTEKIALPISGKFSKVEVVEVPARIKDRLKAAEYLLKVNRAFTQVDESKTVPDVIKIIPFQGHNDEESTFTE